MFELKPTLEMSLVPPSHFTAGQVKLQVEMRDGSRFKTVLGLTPLGLCPHGLLPEDLVLGYLFSETNSQSPRTPG